MSKQPDEPLNFTVLKTKLEAKGFKQGTIPYCDYFSRKRKAGSWWKFWLPISYELVIVRHLIWFYEKKEIGWDSKLEIKTWGRNQKSLEGFMETL
jgi:hypothetical protein